MAVSHCKFSQANTKEKEKMDRSEVSERLTGVLVSELGLDESKIKDDAHFEEDLDVDSLGVVELLMALEDEFDVKIPDEEAESIVTVGQAVDLVHQKLS
jgi:acyl carrier protein